MKFSFTECFMTISLVGIIFLSVFSYNAYGHYGDQLSGYGTAKIDGIRSAGEWDNAHIILVESQIAIYCW